MEFSKMVLRRLQIFDVSDASSVRDTVVHLDSAATPRRTMLPAKITPACVWFTGLSGSGKTTIARALETALIERGERPFVIDGDLVRKGLCRDLGFSAADRIENMRRIAELARLIVDGGLIALVACISPFEAERQAVRARFSADQFIDVYIDTPLEICEARDCKGLYARARAGKIADFTGISSPYDVPQNPDVRLDGTGALPPDTLAQDVMTALARHQSGNQL
jgi:bifunctional enzyme CysN/CysC